MNVDDPKLTAYALDELDEPERSIVARATADSPEVQRFVADTQKLARALRSEYELQLDKELIARKTFALVHDDAFWSKTGPLAIAALLAVLAVLGAVAVSSNKSRTAGISESSLPRDLAGARPQSNQFAPVEGEEQEQASQKQNPEADAGPYAYTGERPFTSALSRPRSSVPLLVDSASYLGVRRSINAGALPSRDSVRIEGMINYFSYADPQPMGHEPVSMNVDVVTCPWEPTHRLMRIALKVHEAIAVPADSRIEVEFNTTRVASYRLIGYDRQTSETQALNQQNVGSRSMAAGYMLTTFYEVVPLKRVGTAAHRQMPSVLGEASEPLLTAKLQLKTRRNDDAARLIERAVSDPGFDF